jgi:hypothetical protein
MSMIRDDLIERSDDIHWLAGFDPIAPTYSRKMRSSSMCQRRRSGFS